MFNQPSTFIDEVDQRLFEWVETGDSALRATRYAPPKGEWSWEGDDASWEEPAVQLKPNTVFKKEPPKNKPKPGSFLGDH